MSREEAARYIGVGPTKFDEMVADGRMPKPKRIDARVVWDRLRVDAAFSGLPDERKINPLDRMYVQNGSCSPNAALRKRLTMDPEKFANKGHAYKHDDLTIDAGTLHPDYEVELGDAGVSATGKLSMFKLFPKSGTGPRFEGRWDDKQEELDVDVFDVTKEENAKFKGKADGYCGHHNGKANFDSTGRTYSLKIAWPAIGTIIEGTANFKVHRRLPTGTGHFSIK